MAANNYEDRIKSSYTLFCTRHVWSEWDFGENDNEVEQALHRELHSDRKCRLFFRYQASYSPTEHKELRRERSNQSLIIKGMILAAIVSAVVAAIFQHIFS